MNEALLQRLAVALAIGLVVGLERGWKTREQHAGQRVAGIRSFTLVGLLGGATGALASPDRIIVLAAGLVAMGALVVASYLMNVGARHELGITTEVALMATYALGAVAVLGAPFEAAAGAIVMALVLGFKTEVHRVVGGIERQELLATLQLLLIAAVVVPLLPARHLGPWKALNPRTIGMLVLLIAGLSYVGYFAVKVFGSRFGLLLTAVCGGLSSSTAVTVAYARRSGSLPSLQVLLGMGIALAAATMAPRLALEIGFVNAAILRKLWPTLLVLCAVPLVPLIWILPAQARRSSDAGVSLTNPLQLRSALGFGLLLSLLFLAAAALEARLGDVGVYTTAAIAGLVDVDAIGLAFAEAAGRTLEVATAQRAIALALLVNTASKAALAALLGGLPMLRSASAILLVAMLAAALTARLTL